jgi:hypothetical protein
LINAIRRLSEKNGRKVTIAAGKEGFGGNSHSSTSQQRKQGTFLRRNTQLSAGKIHQILEQRWEVLVNAEL